MDHRETLADLSFIEHALRTRVAMLTPRHQLLLRESRTLARLREALAVATARRAPTDEILSVKQELLVAVEHRLNKLEQREGKASMSFFGAPRPYAWSRATKVSTVS
jgi:hypothetical protein